MMRTNTKIGSRNTTPSNLKQTGKLSKPMVTQKNKSAVASRKKHFVRHDYNDYAMMSVEDCVNFLSEPDGDEQVVSKEGNKEEEAVDISINCEKEDNEHLGPSSSKDELQAAEPEKSKPFTKLRVMPQRRRTPRNGSSPPFPTKLHMMLSSVADDGFEHIVSWQPHGRCFVVHDPKEFVSLVMPKYFRQSKLTSFQRQLNLYGFSRLTSGRDRGGYYHQRFLRYRSFLCEGLIRIRIKGNGVKGRASPETEPDFYAMPFCSSGPSTQEGQLEGEVVANVGSMEPIVETIVVDISSTRVGDNTADSEIYVAHTITEPPLSPAASGKKRPSEAKEPQVAHSPSINEGRKKFKYPSSPEAKTCSDLCVSPCSFLGSPIEDGQIRNRNSSASPRSSTESFIGESPKRKSGSISASHFLCLPDVVASVTPDSERMLTKLPSKAPPSSSFISPSSGSGSGYYASNFTPSEESAQSTFRQSRHLFDHNDDDCHMCLPFNYKNDQAQQITPTVEIGTFRPSGTESSFSNDSESSQSPLTLPSVLGHQENDNDATVFFEGQHFHYLDSFKEQGIPPSIQPKPTLEPEFPIASFSFLAATTSVPFPSLAAPPHLPRVFVEDVQHQLSQPQVLTKPTPQQNISTSDKRNACFEGAMMVSHQVSDLSPRSANDFFYAVDNDCEISSVSDDDITAFVPRSKVTSSSSSSPPSSSFSPSDIVVPSRTSSSIYDIERDFDPQTIFPEDNNCSVGTVSYCCENVFDVEFLFDN